MLEKFVFLSIAKSLLQSIKLTKEHKKTTKFSIQDKERRRLSRALLLFDIGSLDVAMDDGSYFLLMIRSPRSCMPPLQNRSFFINFTI